MNYLRMTLHKLDQRHQPKQYRNHPPHPKPQKPAYAKRKDGLLAFITARQEEKWREVLEEYRNERRSAEA